MYIIVFMFQNLLVCIMDQNSRETDLGGFSTVMFHSINVCNNSRGLIHNTSVLVSRFQDLPVQIYAINLEELKGCEPGVKYCMATIEKQRVEHFPSAQ